MPRPAPKILKRTCVICDKNFEVKDTKRGRERKTCSPSCSSKLSIINQKKIELPCRRCNNIVKINQSAKNLPVYCSDECRKKKHHLKCKHCGNKFYTSHHDSNTCSKHCAAEYAKRKLKKAKCTNCGTEFERYSLSVRAKGNNFCTLKCANRYFGNKRESTSQRYGKDWHIVREERLKLDKYTCLSCLKHAKDLNTRLEVHHVIPIKTFSHPDEGNYMKNLRTLCSTCHHKVEDGRLECPPHYIKDIHF